MHNVINKDGTFISQIVYPQQLIEIESTCLLIGWNTEQFQCTIACAISVPFHKSEIVHDFLQRSFHDPSFPLSAFYQYPYPPIILGEWHPNLNDDYVPQSQFQSSGIWITLSKTRPPKSQISLHSIYSLGIRYDTSCYLISYHQLRIQSSLFRWKGDNFACLSYQTKPMFSLHPDTTHSSIYPWKEKTKLDMIITQINTSYQLEARLVRELASILYPSLHPTSPKPLSQQSPPTTTTTSSSPLSSLHSNLTRFLYQILFYSISIWIFFLQTFSTLLLLPIPSWLLQLSYLISWREIASTRVCPKSALRSRYVQDETRYLYEYSYCFYTCYHKIQSITVLFTYLHIFLLQVTTTSTSTNGQLMSPKLSSSYHPTTTTSNLLHSKNQPIIKNIVTQKQIWIRIHHYLVILVMDMLIGVLGYHLLNTYYPTLITIHTWQYLIDYVRIHLIEHYLTWFNNSPGGIKLIIPLTRKIEQFILLFLSIMRYLLTSLFLSFTPFLGYFLHATTYFGVSITIALLLDIFLCVSYPITLLHKGISYMFQFHRQLLYSLVLLFQGTKINILRRLRIDTYEYDQISLLFGILLFTIMFFTFPTMTMYYGWMLCIRLCQVGIVYVGWKALNGIIYFPYYPFWLYLRQSPLITDQLEVVLENSTPSREVNIVPLTITRTMNQHTNNNNNNNNNHTGIDTSNIHRSTKSTTTVTAMHRAQKQAQKQQQQSVLPGKSSRTKQLQPPPSIQQPMHSNSILLSSNDDDILNLIQEMSPKIGNTTGNGMARPVRSFFSSSYNEFDSDQDGDGGGEEEEDDLFQSKETTALLQGNLDYHKSTTTATTTTHSSKVVSPYQHEQQLSRRYGKIVSTEESSVRSSGGNGVVGGVRIPSTKENEVEEEEELIISTRHSTSKELILETPDEQEEYSDNSMFLSTDEEFYQYSTTTTSSRTLHSPKDMLGIRSTSSLYSSSYASKYAFPMSNSTEFIPPFSHHGTANGFRSYHSSTTGLSSSHHSNDTSSYRSMIYPKLIQLQLQGKRRSVIGIISSYTPWWYSYTILETEYLWNIATAVYVSNPIVFQGIEYMMKMDEYIWQQEQCQDLLIDQKVSSFMHNQTTAKELRSKGLRPILTMKQYWDVCEFFKREMLTHHTTELPSPPPSIPSSMSSNNCSNSERTKDPARKRGTAGLYADERSTQYLSSLLFFRILCVLLIQSLCCAYMVGNATYLVFTSTSFPSSSSQLNATHNPLDTSLSHVRLHSQKIVTHPTMINKLPEDRKEDTVPTMAATRKVNKLMLLDLAPPTLFPTIQSIITNTSTSTSTTTSTSTSTTTNTSTINTLQPENPYQAAFLLTMKNESSQHTVNRKSFVATQADRMSTTTAMTSGGQRPTSSVIISTVNVATNVLPANTVN